MRYVGLHLVDRVSVDLEKVHLIAAQIATERAAAVAKDYGVKSVAVVCSWSWSRKRIDYCVN